MVGGSGAGGAPASGGAGCDMGGENTPAGGGVNPARPRAPARDGYSKTTGSPGRASRENQSASQLVSRTHPWDAE